MLKHRQNPVPLWSALEDLREILMCLKASLLSQCHYPKCRNVAAAAAAAGCMSNTPVQLISPTYAPVYYRDGLKVTFCCSSSGQRSEESLCSLNIKASHFIPFWSESPECPESVQRVLSVWKFILEILSVLEKVSKLEKSQCWSVLAPGR